MSRSHTRRRVRKTKVGTVNDCETGRIVQSLWEPETPRAFHRRICEAAQLTQKEGRRITPPKLQSGPTDPAT